MTAVGGSAPFETNYSSQLSDRQQIVDKFNNKGKLDLLNILHDGINIIKNVSQDHFKGLSNAQLEKSLNIYNGIEFDGNFQKLITQQLITDDQFNPVNETGEKLLSFIGELAKNDISPEEIKQFAANNQGKTFTTEELIAEIKSMRTEPSSQATSSAGSLSSRIGVVSHSLLRQEGSSTEHASRELAATPLSFEPDEMEEVETHTLSTRALPAREQTSRVIPASPLDIQEIDAKSEVSRSSSSADKPVEESKKKSLWSSVKKMGLAFKEAIGLADKINRKHEDYTKLQVIEEKLEKFKGAFVNSQLFPGSVHLTSKDKSELMALQTELQEISKNHGNEVLEDDRTKMIGTRAERSLGFIDNLNKIFPK